MKQFFQQTLKKIIFTFSIVLPLFPLLAQKTESPTSPVKRFFYMGDGSLLLQGQKILYRNLSGEYQEAGLKKIHQIFGANWQSKHERLSLRFIEMMDYLQDELQGGNYILRSGYRSPNNNQNLRNKGKLAAQSSMHIEGAAADLRLKNIPSAKVFEFVKALNCCGIGWYGSAHFHLDTGPTRYWGATTSKTEDKTPQQNSKIILQSDYDYYQAGEKIPLKFMRITQYPIGVPYQVTLVEVKNDSSQEKIRPLPLTFSSENTSQETCTILKNRSQARNISVQLPKELPSGNYALSVKFCNRYDYLQMPETISSRIFKVVQSK
ncbi:MAG: YcbK family protein [Deltaproteobacteria bacterium]|nr:YcbK family protein [Deltaproteobacteria bacterium]